MSALIPFQRSYERYTMRDLTTILYIYAVALEMLEHMDSSGFVYNYYYTTHVEVKKKGIQTDLAALLLPMHDENTAKLTKNFESHKGIFLRMSSFYDELEKWLNAKLYSPWSDKRSDAFFHFFYKVAMIGNSDYLDCWIITNEWLRNEDEHKMAGYTRMLYALRAKCPHGDILHQFETAGNKMNLELKNIGRNPETGERIYHGLAGVVSRAFKKMFSPPPRTFAQQFCGEQPEDIFSKIGKNKFMESEEDNFISSTKTSSSLSENENKIIPNTWENDQDDQNYPGLSNLTPEKRKKLLFI